MTLAPDPIIISGALLLPSELSDRYFALVAENIRQMRDEDLHERNLRRAVYIAIRRCRSEAIT